MTVDERAQALGVAWATHEFTMALNPKYRGPNLTWDRVRARVKSVVIANAHTSYSPGVFTRNRKRIEETAIRVATETLERLFKDSGVLNWMPLPESTKPRHAR